MNNNNFISFSSIVNILIPEPRNKGFTHFFQQYTLFSILTLMVGGGGGGGGVGEFLLLYEKPKVPFDS